MNTESIIRNLKELDNRCERGFEVQPNHPHRKALAEAIAILEYVNVEIIKKMISEQEQQRSVATVDAQGVTDDKIKTSSPITGSDTEILDSLSELVRTISRAMNKKEFIKSVDEERLNRAKELLAKYSDKS